MSHKFKEHGDKNAACDSEEKEVCEQCASEASERKRRRHATIPTRRYKSFKTS